MLLLPLVGGAAKLQERMEHLHLALVGSLAVLLLCLPAVRGQFDGTNCAMLLESELGDTMAPVNTGLLAMALSTAEATATVQLVQFDIVCQAQGTERDTYRSLSLIVEYMPALTSGSPTQLQLQCVGGMWSIVMPDVAVSVPTPAASTATLRSDCIACFNPLEVMTVTADEHCLGKDRLK